MIFGGVLSSPEQWLGATTIKDKCNGGESCNPYSEVSGGQDDDSLRVPPDSHQAYSHESRGRADEVQAPLDPGNKDEEFDVESAR